MGRLRAYRIVGNLVFGMSCIYHMRYVDFFNLAETVGCVCMHGGEEWRGTGMPDRGQELLQDGHSAAA